VIIVTGRHAVIALTHLLTAGTGTVFHTGSTS
jgi:hypothetical protein